MFKKLMLCALACLYSTYALSNVLLHVEVTVQEEKHSGAFDLNDGQAAAIQYNEDTFFVIQIDPKENEAIAITLNVIRKEQDSQEEQLLSTLTVDTFWSTVAEFNFTDAPVTLKVVAMKNNPVAEVQQEEVQAPAQIEQN